MKIPGDYEDRKISPAVWECFEDFWGDKAYRQAGFVAEFEALVRGVVASDIAERGEALRDDEESPISRDERDCYDDAAEVAVYGLEGAGA